MLLYCSESEKTKTVYHLSCKVLASELHNDNYKDEYCQCLDILDLDHRDCKSVLGSNKEALSTAECLSILPCRHHLMTTKCEIGKVNVNKMKV